MTTKTILSVIAAGGAAYAAFAQAPLAGQAGNDTTARAQAPQAAVNPKPTPTAAPVSEKPVADPNDAVKIGVIEHVQLVGHPDFVGDESVSGLLTAALCDGGEKTVGDLKAAMAAAKSSLVARGFYLATVGLARVDAYDAATRTMEISVDSGRFGSVTLRRAEDDGGWYGDELVLKRFKFVKEGEPFNYLTLRQALRAVNVHPDLRGDAELKVRRDAANPKGPRVVDTELTVEDAFPLHGTLDVNNYGMDELKNWQAVLTLQYLNLTGAEDALVVSPGMSFNGEMWSVAGNYTRPFELLLGGSWSIYGGYSSMDCSEVLDRLDLYGLGGFAGLSTSWNLWDTDVRNVSLNLGLQWRYIEDEWSALSTLLRNRDVSILPFTFGLSYADKRRDWLGGLDSASVSETVNILNNANAFREYSEEADAAYWIFRANWARLQPLVGPGTDGDEWRCWSLFSKIEGQYSANSLITAERLAYGGQSCLRGYRRRGYLGDSGVYGTAEFRTPFWCNTLADLFCDDLTTAIDRIQFFVFTDLGHLHYSDVYANMDRDEFLWSAGFGARAGLTRFTSLNLDVAFPLVDGYAADEDKSCELYLSVRAQF